MQVVLGDHPFQWKCGPQASYNICRTSCLHGMCSPSPGRGNAPQSQSKEPLRTTVDALLSLVFDEVLEDPSPFVEGLKKIPITANLSSQYEGPPKEVVVARHVSCFKSRGGRNPTYCPARSGNSWRIRSTTHEGMTTLTSTPSSPSTS
ncbi:unnamed protein product [Lota lota]